MDIKVHVIAHDECVFVHSLNGPKISDSLPSWPLSDDVVLEYKRNKWYIIDNQSHRGVYHNGKKIKVSAPVALKNGSVLFLGPSEEAILKYECFYVTSSRSYRTTQQNKRQKTKNADVVCSGANCREKNLPNAELASSEESQNDRIISLPVTRSKSAAKTSINQKNDGKSDEKVKERKILVPQNRGKRRKQSGQNSQQGINKHVTISQKRFDELEAYEKRCLEFDSKETFSESMEGLLDKNFTCAICTELYIKAVLLGCSHTFCSDCLHKCKQRSSQCPICRATIDSEYKANCIDEFIDDMVEKMEPEFKHRRIEIVEERSKRYTAELARRERQLSSSSSSSSSSSIIDPPESANLRSALMVVRLMSRIIDERSSDSDSD